MQTLRFSIIAILLHLQLIAQPLHIGNRLPDIQIHNIINGNDPSINTNSFTGKMLLFDFGATTCVPCLKILPLLDSLQKQFTGKLQVFMVTAESKEKVQRFLHTNKIAKQCSLPVITGDSLLSACFPHSALPHEVWINADGIVVAITDHEYISAANIRQVLDKQALTWAVKADALTSTDAQILDLPGELNQPLYYSSFRNYLPGYKTRGIKKTDTLSGTYSIRCTNYTIPDMYKMILGIRASSFYPKQLIADASLLHRLFYDSSYGYKAEWEQKNKYCYEGRFPRGASPQQLEEKMKKDLDLYLGITTLYEKRLVDCMVLSQATGSWNVAARKIQGQNTVKTVMNYYNYIDTLPLLLNETGFSDNELDNCYISISKNEMKNEPLLFQALQQAGFVCHREKRWVLILEIKQSLENQE